MRRDIQGLRGVAVLIVVLFHGSLGFDGGFVGVDIFFVISGYVITGVLVRDASSTQSTSSVLLSFYVRRIRRLLPALGTLIGATLIASFAFESSLREQSRTAWSAIASLLFSANIRLLTMSDGYFSLGSQTNPVLHVWSLSIEEQFYFCFPLAYLYLARKNDGRSRVRKWFAVGAGLSLVLCVLLTYGAIGGSGAERYAFYLPFTRAWEFLAGSLAFQAATAKGIRRNSPLRRILIVGGIAGISWSAVVLNESWSFPGGIALVPVLASTALLIAGSGTEISVLTWKPLVWLGDRSYGWYLWHWPMIVFALHEYPRGQVAAPIAALASIVPASISYSVIEQPIRNRSGWGSLSTRQVCAVFLIIPLGIATVAGIRSRENQGVSRLSDKGDLASSSIEQCAVNETLCLPTDGSSSVAVLAGDSHAGMIAQQFEVASRNSGLEPAIASILGCPFIDTNVDLYLYNFEKTNLMTSNDCSADNGRFMDWVRSNRPQLVMLVNNSPLYTQAPGFDERFDLRVACMTGSGSGCLPSSDFAQRVGYFEEQLTKAVNELTRYTQTVVLSLPMPQMFREPDQFVKSSDLIGTPKSAIDEYRKSLLPVYQNLVTNSKVILFDPVKYLCTDDLCPNGDAEGSWYSDNGHLGPRGSARLIEPLTKLFRQLGQG